MGYILMAEAATIPGPNHAACFDESCRGFECDDGYAWMAEAADILGLTLAVCCNKSCSAFECDVDYTTSRLRLPPLQRPTILHAALSPALDSSAKMATC